MAAGLRQASVMPTLAVTDIAKARDFYSRVLGLELVNTGIEDEGDALFQTADGGYLYVYERPSPSGSTATACSFSVDNADEIIEGLRSNGVKFEDYDIPEMDLKTVNGVHRKDGMITAWFKDPSGNILSVGNFRSILAQKGNVAWKQAPASTETRVH